MKDTFACAAIDSNEMGPCSHFVLVPNYSTYNHRLRAPASDSSYQYISNDIGKAGFFTFSPIFYFIVIRYFFPFHSKNWIAQSTSLFYHSISTPFLPPHYNIHFIIASSIFISHQNLSPNHVRMPSPMQRFKKSMLPGHFQSTFQCSRSFSISPYYNRF